MSLQSGDVIEGKITGITSFGLFVDVGGRRRGMVHISEAADGFVRDLNELFAVGQLVRAKVINIDCKGRIALSIRRLADDDQPAASAVRRHGAKPAEARGGQNGGGKNQFEDKLNKFFRDSDQKLAEYRRNMDAKRGGRGGRHG